MDRLEFRKVIQKLGIYQSTTSGSTGISVVVQKYPEQLANCHKAEKLLADWFDWDRFAPTLKITPIIPHQFQRGRTTYSNTDMPGAFKQLIAFPSSLPGNLERFERILCYGEPWTGVGIDSYSSEEFGMIALQCPIDSTHMHIMDHLEINFTANGMSITDTTHPYLKDYEIGDYAEPVFCNCGIGLKAMTHVRGRIRNQIKMPNGGSKWPLLGLLGFPEIERFQVFQESLYTLRVHIDGVMPQAAIKSMRRALGFNFNIKVVQGGFKDGKHEEFICEI
jgi:hypothetical protein